MKNEKVVHYNTLGIITLESIVMVYLWLLVL